MNKAKEGLDQEKVYTKLLNQKTSFWDKLPFNKEETFAIHITSQQYGALNESKTPTKADIYFSIGNVPQEYLLANNFYLTESDVQDFNLEPIPRSGVSVKLPGAKKYTIMKMAPNTFIKIFGSNVLGAGSSIYCSKEQEFYKNKDILNGWNVTEDEFLDYFKSKLSNNLDKINLLNKQSLKAVKTYSNNEISRIIDSSKQISDFIFMGIGNFKEPYTAYWIIKGDEIMPNYYIPYYITTGNGRSNGKFSIAVKAK